ncbi:MAG: NRDE family protein [Gemmataceae bacterium]|nr:NRDE family protein [Gemmataceae bacterium]MDW8265626.1 NRDE family protein [Gemmataceae bacterium]
MCLVVLCFRAVPDAAIVLAANREEAYARGGEPPQVWAGEVPFVAGRDPVAGGTWLGVNALGVVVAVTNRRKTHVPAGAVSRGLLVCAALRRQSAAEAADAAVRELASGNYAGCNLLCADADRAYVVHAGDWLRVRPLTPGLHLLAAGDVNDAHDPRLAHARRWLSAQRWSDAGTCAAALQRLCAQSGNGSPAMCLHGPEAGTVSSTIVVVRQPVSRGWLGHAQGPPDRVGYEDYSYLLRRLNREASG